MINNQYKPFYQRARTMQANMHTMMGTGSPQAYALNRQMTGLLSDMSMNRHPAIIDSRIKTIERQMTQMQHQGQGMQMAYSPGAAVNMHQSFRQLSRGMHNAYRPR